jgi:hypothetical protein
MSLKEEFTAAVKQAEPSSAIALEGALRNVFVDVKNIADMSEVIEGIKSLEPAAQTRVVDTLENMAATYVGTAEPFKAFEGLKALENTYPDIAQSMVDKLHAQFHLYEYIAAVKQEKVNPFITDVLKRVSEVPAEGQNSPAEGQNSIVALMGAVEAASEASRRKKTQEAGPNVVNVAGLGPTIIRPGYR